MSRLSNFIKNLRPEYRVALFFVLILVFYMGYSFISQAFFDKDSGGAILGSPQNRGVGASKPGNITEALTAERPVIVSTEARESKFDEMKTEKPEVKGIELMAEVENPAVWIYIGNDGSRKDNLASEYCKWLHNNGIMASSVTILDAAARTKGRIVEIGESLCM